MSQQTGSGPAGRVPILQATTLPFLADASLMLSLWRTPKPNTHFLWVFLLPPFPFFTEDSGSHWEGTVLSPRPDAISSTAS